MQVTTQQHKDPKRILRGEAHLKVLFHAHGIRTLGHDSRPSLHAPAERHLSWCHIVCCYYALKFRVLEEQWVRRSCRARISIQDLIIMQIDSPKGEYPVRRMPLASQYALSSVSGRHG